ncbi:MAG: nucleotidyltransferase family protein [Acidobacteria bacterium]|nr:nucleotidyltransferase family protein [Acidobacteriota bacterium]
MNISSLKNRLAPLCRKHDVRSLRVFGSMSRGELRKDSDVDLLISFRTPVGMLTLIKLEQQMSQALNRNVDLGTESSLHPLIRENVEKDLKLVYGE